MRTFVFIVHQNNLVPYIYIFIYISWRGFFLGGGQMDRGIQGFYLDEGGKMVGKV